MGIYARPSWRLVRQVGSDIFAVLWGLAWWGAAGLVGGAVRALAEPARQTAGAARQMSEGFLGAAQQAGQIPGIGGELRKPFDAAAAALGDVVRAASGQVSSIEQLATIVGWLVFLLPVALYCVFWLPARIRFYLNSRAAQGFIDSAADLDLFALRAMSRQPMHLLARISDDPVKAWRDGDRAVIGRLAELELAGSGLRLPAQLSQRPAPASTVAASDSTGEQVSD